MQVTNEPTKRISMTIAIEHSQGAAEIPLGDEASPS
jgi:hypothetical protein